MMKIMRIQQLLMIVITSLLLMSCGGSNELSGTLSISLTAPTAAGLPGLAVATYAASDGRNPQGVEVSFSTDHPEIIKFNNSTATCDATGAASAQFTFISIPSDVTATIYATTGGLSQFATLTIAGNPDAPPPVTPVAAVPTSIVFSVASPASITLKGMGGTGTSETSDISFIVKDANNVGIAGTVVDFSLDTSVGGIVLSPAFATSDSTGRVVTKVSAGIIATPVKVTASVRGTALSTTSDQLVILAGFPDQDSLSVSVSKLSPECWLIDGVEVDVTARIADHFNNPVKNASIYFTTEGGSIDGFCITNASGACSVKWRSMNPRPSNGRVTILAYAVGEEAFIDLNGNGLADTGEFLDNPEAFRDDNENNVYDLATETFIDFNGSGSYNNADGFYNGALRSAAIPLSIAKTKHIYSNSTVVMSSSSAVITTNLPLEVINGISTPVIDAPRAFTIFVADVNGNTMPAGTKIDVTTDNGTLSGVASVTIPDNADATGYALPLDIIADATPSSGAVTVKVTSPNGLITWSTIKIKGGI